MFYIDLDVVVSIPTHEIPGFTEDPKDLTKDHEHILHVT